MKNSKINQALPLLSLLCAALTQASECRDLPEAAVAGVDALIERSPRIVLVTLEATSGAATPPGEPRPSLDREAALRKATVAVAPDRATMAIGTARLTVIEDIKGHGEPEIERRTVSPGRRQHDFDAHRDESFWSDSTAGLVGFDAACRPEMAFEPGKTYLVFDGPAHVKAAELIESADDAWLQYVREKAAL